MRVWQKYMTKLKALMILPLCLLVACASSPQTRSDNNGEIFDSEGGYYFEHIDDDPTKVTGKSVSPVPPSKTKKSPTIEAKDEKPLPAVAPPKLSLKQRMPKVNADDQIPSWISSKNYSFKANNLDVRDALKMFSRMYGLNIYYEPEVKGKITVEFSGLPLKKALEVILNSHKLYWQWQSNLIYVGKFQTKNYVIDYIRLTRTGSSNSNISVSSQSGSNTTITQSDNISFWDELDIQLKNLISETGKLTINRTTGNIQITDTPDHIQQAEKFINNIKKTLTRQVLIEARIVEVQLNDDNRLGVDWGEMNFLNFTAITSTMAGLTNGGLSLKTATANLTYNDGRFKAMLNALSEQGNVKVMSQPRIRTMNNQPAIIKAGTDRTFFSTTATATTSSGSTQVVTSEKATTVTEGIVLSITPQISGDGNITLDISPVLTRISDVTVSQHGSTAPVLDIKQTSALIQVASGEMAVIGGMIQDLKVKQSRHVPVLGNIPVIGRFFSSESTSIQRSELVIYLVAKII